MRTLIFLLNLSLSIASKQKHTLCAVARIPKSPDHDDEHVCDYKQNRQMISYNIHAKYVHLWGNNFVILLHICGWFRSMQIAKIRFFQRFEEAILFTSFSQFECNTSQNQI